MPKSHRKEQMEIHGKLDSKDGEFTRLEQIWGFNELSKYGTLNEEEYQKNLLEMSKIDLQAHAREIGIVPIDSVERLTQNLMREFKNYVFYLHKPIKAKVAPKNPTKSIKNILSEGR